MGIVKSMIRKVWPKSTDKEELETENRSVIDIEPFQSKLPDNSEVSPFFGNFQHRFCCAGTSNSDKSALVSYLIKRYPGKSVVISNSALTSGLRDHQNVTVIRYADLQQQEFSFLPLIQNAMSEDGNNHFVINALHQVYNWLEGKDSEFESDIAHDFDNVLSFQLMVAKQKQHELIQTYFNNGSSDPKGDIIIFETDDVPVEELHIFMILAAIVGNQLLCQGRKQGMMIFNENEKYPIFAKRHLTPLVAELLKVQKNILLIRDKLIDDIYETDPIYSSCSHYLAFNGGVNTSNIELRELFSDVYPIDPNGDPEIINVAAVEYSNQVSTLIEIPK